MCHKYENLNKAKQLKMIIIIIIIIFIIIIIIIVGTIITNIIIKIIIIILFKVGNLHSQIKYTNSSQQINLQRKNKYSIKRQSS